MRMSLSMHNSVSLFVFTIQELSIEIADRDPTDNPGGIPYKLLAEACIPSINVDDLGSIFEEHRVCKNLSVWQHSNSVRTFWCIAVLLGDNKSMAMKLTSCNIQC